MSPRRTRSVALGRSQRPFRQVPVGQTRSLAGFLLIVVTLSTFGVTTTFRRVLQGETSSHLPQQILEDHHPLSGRRRRKLRHLKPLPAVSNAAPSTTTRTTTTTTIPRRQQPQPEASPWHVLSFGSATTYGSGLQNETAQAYPYLLDPETAVSVALPTGHWYADMAAACTQTMVVSNDLEQGQDASTSMASSFSLLTIEYYEFTESHLVLIQRLRRRYPTAVIVLVRLLQPATQLILECSVAERTKTSSSHQEEEPQLHPVTYLSFADWKARRDVKHEPSQDGSSRDEQLLRSGEDMIREAAAALGTWMLVPTATETDTRITSLLYRDHLVLHHQLAVPMDFRSRQDLENFLLLYNYQGDATLLSAAGHKAVADSIKGLIRSVRVPSASTTVGWSVAGNWGSGDDCHVWYATGNYNLESSGRRVNLPIQEGRRSGIGRQVYAGLSLLSSLSSIAAVALGTHKHALEFDRIKAVSNFFSSNGGSSGSTTTNQISVHNPFDHDRLLSLTYLTDADSMSYPKTRVVVNGAPTVLLQPFHDFALEQSASSSRHVARTSGVGFVPPGTSTVQLEPLQSTKLPFRLLGASFLAEEVQNLPSIEFALETDSWEANDDDKVVDITIDRVGGTNPSPSGFVSKLFGR